MREARALRRLSRADQRWRKENTMKLGFLGLGNMGYAMASTLLGAGHSVAVWNRSP